MPISTMKRIKCRKCKRKFATMIGDVRPVLVRCPFCGHQWMYLDDGIGFPFGL